MTSTRQSNGRVASGINETKQPAGGGRVDDDRMRIALVMSFLTQKRVLFVIDCPGIDR